MRSRERILANLESIYRESYDRAQRLSDDGRMLDLESAYMRDQLMMEIFLDLRDLCSVPPAAGTTTGSNALDTLEAVRRLTKLR